MGRSSLMRTILFVAAVLIVIGVILMHFMLDAFRTGSVINVYLKDGKTEIVEFKDLALVPGQSREYELTMTGSPAKRYNVKLDFVENTDGKLKNFVYVKIISGTKVICDQLLADAMVDEQLVLPVDFGENAYTDLTLIYYLPVEVGNEAKNAEAKFSLLFIANEE